MGQNIYKWLEGVPKVFLLGAPHSGSTFIHSLLDNHPQILAVPFLLRIHDRCWNPYLNYLPKKGISEFVRKTFSEEACSETTHPGCLALSTTTYHERLTSLLEKNGFNRRELFLAVYQAYIEETKTDLAEKKILLEHTHTTFCVDDILEDFENARFIQPIRDPRALYNSFVVRAKRIRGGNEYWNLKLILQAFTNINYFKGLLANDRYLILKNEDLMPPLEKAMRQLACWLGVDFHKNMEHATFDGIIWKGNTAYRDMDRVTPKILSTRWEKDLNEKSKMLVEYLFKEHMQEYGYELIKLTGDNGLERHVKGLLAMFTAFQPQSYMKDGNGRQKMEKWGSIAKAPISRLWLKFIYYKIPDLQKSSGKIGFIKPWGNNQLLDLGNFFFPRLEGILKSRRKMRSRKIYG